MEWGGAQEGVAYHLCGRMGSTVSKRINLGQTRMHHMALDVVEALQKVPHCLS